jgi:hypothetical protein
MLADPQMADEPATMLDAALAMAARRLRVFPLAPGTKDRPLIKDWPEFATTDEAIIRKVWTRFPDANVAILCDDMIVIDVDVKGGKPGMASLIDLDLDLNTFTVRTPTGGLHVYFTGPNVKNSVGRIGPGLDIRSRHGYVVAPGSRTDAGTYTVSNNSAIMRAEPGLLERCSAVALTVVEGGLSLDVSDTEDAIARATHFLSVEAEPAIQGQGGDAKTLKTAMALKDMGLSQGAAFDLMAEHWNDRCDPPWLLDELRTKVQNAYRYGLLPPGVSAPEHQFKTVAVEQPAAAPSPWYHHGDPWSFDFSWLFHKLLPAVGVAVVEGESQVGKSFFILELARCLATGTPIFGTPPEERGGTLLLYAGTEGSGIEERMMALREADRLPIAFRAITSSLATAGALAALQDDIEAKAAQMLAQFGVPIRMVVFETLSASGLLKDENDNSEAAAAIAILGNMSKRMNALFVTTHHPPKAGKGSRGASAIPNSADVRIEITRESMGSVREVALVKARTAPQRKLGSYTLVEVELGHDKKDRPVVSCTLSTGAVQTSSQKVAAHSELFMQCVEHATVNAQKEDPEATMPEECDVRDMFNSRCPIVDRSNRAKAYTKVKTWAEQMGAIQIILDNHRTYIKQKEIVT